jgi:hypothetical protein
VAVCIIGSLKPYPYLNHIFTYIEQTGAAVMTYTPIRAVFSPGANSSWHYRILCVENIIIIIIFVGYLTTLKVLKNIASDGRVVD